VKANKGAAAALKVLQLLMGQLARQKLAQQLEVQEAMLRMEKTYNLQEVVIGSLEARPAPRRCRAGSAARPAGRSDLGAAGGAGLSPPCPAGARTPH
jgi:hypothetical protein